MLAKLKQGYPQFPYKHKDERRAAQILFVIIFTVLATYLVVILTSLYRNDWELIWFALGGTVLQIVPLGLLARGHLRSGSFIAILGVLFTVTLMATIGQGMHDIAIMAFPVIIIISSLMLEQRDFTFVSLLTIGAVGWLVFGEVNGWFIPRPFETTNWADFLMMAAILVVAIMAMNLLATNMRRNLELAQQEIAERKRAEEEARRAKASAEEVHRELQQAFAREQQLARTDVLTGVNNRRYWFELAEHEFEVAVRYRRPLAVILFDLDHFKLVNDMFGHAVGDQILERVAQVARTALRSVDVIGRIGGEEFIIVLPVTTAPQAYPVAERIRAGVAAICVETDKEPTAVTLSIGIAETLLALPTERPGGDDSVERVIHRADQAMYATKHAGGNRTSIYSAPMERPGESA